VAFGTLKRPFIFSLIDRTDGSRLRRGRAPRPRWRPHLSVVPTERLGLRGTPREHAPILEPENWAVRFALWNRQRRLENVLPWPGNAKMRGFNRAFLQTLMRSFASVRAFPKANLAWPPTDPLVILFEVTCRITRLGALSRRRLTIRRRNRIWVGRPPPPETPPEAQFDRNAHTIQGRTAASVLIIAALALVPSAFVRQGRRPPVLDAHVDHGSAHRRRLDGLHTHSPAPGSSPGEISC